MATNISTEAQLQACYLTLGVDYTIVNNITITADFRPYAIGKTYAKTFDGGGYTLTNFQLTANGHELGLFKGLTNPGIIRNIVFVNAVVSSAGTPDYRQVAICCGNMLGGTISNVTIASGSCTNNSYFCGCLVGQKSGGTITGCTNSATGASRQYAFGGIVGYVVTTAGTITGCTNTGAMSGLGQLGGIVGQTAPAEAISSCVNTGAISGTTTGRTGGIVGDGTLCSITNCVNTGAIVSTVRPAGGICGYKTTGNIVGCGNSGNVTLTGLGAGGIVGEIQGAMTISGCFSDAATISSTAGYAGGIFGYTPNNVTVTDCWSSSNIASKATYVGGLIGDSEGILTASRCYATGDVTATAVGATHFGGFIGYVANASTVIDNCFATGDVGVTGSAIANNVGGFAGYQNAGSIRRSYATGNVTVGTDFIGAFVGRQQGGTIYDSFSVGGVTGGSTYRGNFCGFRNGTISNCGCSDPGVLRDIGNPAADVTYTGSTDSYRWIGNTTHNLFDAGTYVWDFDTTPAWYVRVRDFPALSDRDVI